MSLWRLSHRLARPSQSKHSLHMSIRSNSAVSTPSQATSPAIVAPPPPRSSYIRGTRKPIGGFRGGYLLWHYLLFTLGLRGFCWEHQLPQLMVITTCLRLCRHNRHC